MSPRTYIGPFGRILPLQDDTEPESLPRPPDESPLVPSVGRAGLPLPQPELKFGSDTSLGFSDPTRYNTAPQRSQRSAQHGDATSSGPVQPGRRAALPSVQHLLAPADNPEVRPSMVAPSLPNDEYSPHKARQKPTPSDGPYNWDNVDYSPQRSGQLRGAGMLFQATQHPLPISSQDRVAPEHASTIHRAPNYNSSGQNVYNSIEHPVDQTQGGASQLSIGHGYQKTMLGAVSPAPKIVASLYSQNPSQAVPDKPRAYGNPSPAGDSSQSGCSKEAKPMPKVVREEFRSGEGAVWVYEDGSVCPKTVDGQNVNAEWGVTKAGKPRKRLALACTSCREKKIKCCPKEPKCEQCERFGRECRYTTATRYGRKQSDSPSHDMQACPQVLNIKKESSATPSTVNSMQNAMDMATTDKRGLEVLSRLRDGQDQRDSSMKKRCLSGGGSHESPLEEHHLKVEDEDLALPTASNDAKRQSAKINEASAERFPATEKSMPVDYYLDLFFENVGSLSAMPLPRALSAELSTRAGDASSGELMLLYAMLAVGTTFSDKNDHRNDGKTFSDWASQAMSRDVFPKAFVQQTRLLLALYHSASGQMTQAWTLAADDLYLALSSGKRCEGKEDVKGIG